MWLKGLTIPCARRSRREPTVPLAKRARVIGTTLRSRTPSEKGEILARTREIVWPLLAAGAITLPVQAHLPLEEAVAAHRILREGGADGWRDQGLSAGCRGPRHPVPCRLRAPERAEPVTCADSPSRRRVRDP